MVSQRTPRRIGRHILLALWLGATLLACGGPTNPAPAAQRKPQGANLLKNGDFGSGTDPWWTTASASLASSGGELTVAISQAGSRPEDTIVGQNTINLQANQTYTASFELRASAPATVLFKIQQETAPYTSYFQQPVNLTTTTQRFEYSFIAPASDPAASFQFHIGGGGAYTMYGDTMALVGQAGADPLPATPESAAQPTAQPVVPSLVRLNQVGYLPQAPKNATVVNAAAAPLAWELRDAQDTVVLSGTSIVHGQDAASGDHVHRVDFSGYATAGDGYRLHVGADISHPFSISPSIYHQLKYDALAYFYHNRSGIAITLPYAGEARWERPAGHLGVAPNQGDTALTCFKGKDSKGREWPGCAYSLDVSKGWYDAGDHGKYVVNGGIATWTLLNLYERASLSGSPLALAQFADGRLNIPENSNGVPDLLDEARWNMEFMLAMQIPAATGDPLAGMVHHKVHDIAWTGIPTAPHDDPQQRVLYPPSTAATLNLAATAAQCARIWRPLDAAFADRCLVAAETAWAAARAHRAEYARNNFTGGGPYDDTRLDDEFYWAAAELYITTNKADYKTQIEGSTLFLSVPTTDGVSMSWGDVEALGTISLALVPNQLAAEQIAQARQNVVAAADSYRKNLAAEGYRTPFTPSTGSYPWGSNSAVLNNMIILGLAYDFTQDHGYADAVSESMDYLLGRNALDKSYVSGYGSFPLTNPHHRFWAAQANAAYPPPPPGAVSGGPNSGLEDPYAQPLLQGCAPQKCYVDHIESWSTNEITINWNAPLAWVAAFLDEQGLK
jgi:endoglucanase